MTEINTGLILKPLEPEDVVHLERWMYSGEYSYFFRDINYLNREALKIYGYMKDGMAFMLWKDFSSPSPIPIGFVVLSYMKMVAQNAQVGILIDKAYHKNRYCSDGMHMAARYIFGKLNYQKMIVEVCEEHKELCQIVEAHHFEKEAVLKNEANIDGKFLNVIRYTMFKDTYGRVYGG